MGQPNPWTTLRPRTVRIGSDRGPIAPCGTPNATDSGSLVAELRAASKVGCEPRHHDTSAAETTALKQQIYVEILSTR